MSTDFGFSDLERKIISAQIERRAKYRALFLKAKSDPCAHSKESYYVFDEAIQRFMAMKVSQLEHFTFNSKTITFGIISIILPMSCYGYVVYKWRQQWLHDIMCGKIKPKDRLFKLC